MPFKQPVVGLNPTGGVNHTKRSARKPEPAIPANAKWKFSGSRVNPGLAAGLDELRPTRERADVQKNRPLIGQAEIGQQFLRLRGRHAPRLSH